MLENLFELSSKSKDIAILIDPDKVTNTGLESLIKRIDSANAKFIFVGGSLVHGAEVDEIIEIIKKHTGIPVILFPGSGLQVSAKADAILFLSLLSGRNPEFLIGHQVMSAPYIKKQGLESIATGYILVDGGKETTASYISNTNPVPADKPQIGAATALAGEMLGFKMIYLDAGSGAKRPISREFITAVRKEIELPIIVGGGIRTKQNIESAFAAGANLVVIGTAIEDDSEFLNTILHLNT